jgi:hypothetical protein
MEFSLDVSLGDKEVEIAGREVQYNLLEFFQKRSGDVRRMGPRVVEQEHQSLLRRIHGTTSSHFA